MKNTPIPSLIFTLLFALSGCEQLDQLTQFNLSFEETVTVPSTAGISVPFDLTTPTITTNVESKLEDKNTSPDHVETIHLTALTLSVESPTGGDFSFLEAIEIYIDADGVDEKKIAWDDAVSSSAGSTLSLTVTEDDLKNYIIADEFSMRVNTTTDEALTENHDIKITTDFLIDAQLTTD